MAEENKNTAKEKREKKKKEKVVYVDDGRTIADMSGLDSARRRGFSATQNTSRPPRAARPRFKDCVKTYFSSVKMMLLPMIVVLLILLGLYLLLSFLLWLG